MDSQLAHLVRVLGKMGRRLTVGVHMVMSADLRSAFTGNESRASAVSAS